MVISHKYRYVFIEVPLTASWAIRNELCMHYGGEPILHKHATYIEFERIASEEENGYFKFATVRNPLDVVVSQYFKYKTNHKEAYTDSRSLEAGLVEQSDLEKFRFVQDRNNSFSDYVQRYHHLPFDSLIDLSADHLDYLEIADCPADEIRLGRFSGKVALIRSAERIE